MQSRCLVTSLLQTELCLSVLATGCDCHCPCYAVPICARHCLPVLEWACLCYAVPNRVQLCWPLCVPLLFRNRMLTLIPLFKFLTQSAKQQHKVFIFEVLRQQIMRASSSKSFILCLNVKTICTKQAKVHFALFDNMTNMEYSQNYY